MSSLIADHNHRDELPLLLAIVLHLVFGGLIYWYATYHGAAPAEHSTRYRATLDLRQPPARRSS